MFNMK
jgi:hypothetical protein